MKKKTVLSGALCLCMLCPSAFALNANTVPAADSSYTVRDDVTNHSSSAGSTSKKLVDVMPVSVPLSADPEGTATVSNETNNASEIDAPATVPAESTPYCVGSRAKVTALETEDRPGTLEVKTDSGETFILQISDETAFVDNQSGTAVSPADIKIGAEIYAYTSPVDGNTVPALVVLTNLGDGAIARLHKIDSSTVGNDLADALCDNGDIIVRTSESTAFSPYRTKQFVSAQEMQPGVSFLAWYDVVAESYPAQATANRIVILPSPEATTETTDAAPAQDAEVVVKVAGNPFSAEKIGEAYQVPARAVGEALGLTVTWHKDHNLNVVSLYNDAGVLSINIDKNEYIYLSSVSDAVPVVRALGIAPHFAPYQNYESVTWVDAAMFEMMGFHVSNADGVLTIQ